MSFAKSDKLPLPKLNIFIYLFTNCSGYDFQYVLNYSGNGRSDDGVGDHGVHFPT